MIKSAAQLSQAEAALDMISSETELMSWHDAWMSSDEYTGMCDTDAKALEAMFELKSVQFASVHLASREIP